VYSCRQEAPNRPPLLHENQGLSLEYFHISNTGVRDFVTAYSFVDAKARAWRMYPDDQERIVWEDNTDPVPDAPTARLFF
jgi:hypothetical protein